jgi:prepilin-type N-terminal cleavage/methylation domain-containing protein
MKKGFTLIELLGVIVILGILVLVAFPPLLNQIKKSKQEINESTKLLIIDAAKDYVKDNENDYDEINGNTYCININTLTENNYLNEKIKDENLNNIKTTKKIKMTYKSNKFEYEVVDECDTTNNGISDKMIAKEIDDIKSVLNTTTKDGIYYYNGYGNLEKDADIIYTNSDTNIRGNILIHNHQLISGCFNYGENNYDLYKTTITKQDYPCSTIRGENLVLNGNLSYGSNLNFESYTYNDGYISYSGSESTTLEATNYISVDIENKSYDMGITAKSNNTTATNYGGFKSYDVDRNEILSKTVMYSTSNDITLTQDLKENDEYMYVSDLSAWNDEATESRQRGFIFWNYVDSTGYQYPPYTYSQNVYQGKYANSSSVEKENNRIHLSSKWPGPTIPAGTMLSQSNSGSVYNYPIFNGTKLTTSWKQYAETTSGIRSEGTLSRTEFRAGTKYIKPATTFNYNNIANVTNDYKDIYVREVIN